MSKTEKLIKKTESWKKGLIAVIRKIRDPILRRETNEHLISLNKEIHQLKNIGALETMTKRKLTNHEIAQLKDGNILEFKLTNGKRYGEIRHDIDWYDLMKMIGLDSDAFAGISPTPVVTDWDDKEGTINISSYP